MDIRKYLGRFDPLAPIRLRPRVRGHTYSYSESHLEKGYDYARGFEVKPGRKLMWEIERAVFSDLIARHVGASAQLHLDFAAGTGRIAEVLSHVAARQVMLDVSEEMLAVARQRSPNARTICADFRGGESGLTEASVDVATAFRFFANAELALRDDALEFLATVLRPGGVLIANNHRNFWSLPYALGRFMFLRGAADGMNNREFVLRAARHGLKCVEKVSLGVVPQSERFSILPWSMTERVERTMMSRYARRHDLGYNTLFVFKRVIC